MNDVREDESYSDSDDETRATKFGDNDETDGGREDDSVQTATTSALVLTSVT